MGLFDDVFGSPSSTKDYTAAEAFAGILLAANASDGHVSDEEVQGFVTVICRMKLYENMTANKINGLIDKMHKGMKKLGLQGFIEACSDALPEKLHKTAFANACDMVFADGVVEDEEREFINKLWKALGISGDDAKTIAQVMAIKNQG